MIPLSRKPSFLGLFSKANEMLVRLICGVLRFGTNEIIDTTYLIRQDEDILVVYFYLPCLVLKLHDDQFMRSLSYLYGQ